MAESFYQEVSVATGLPGTSGQSRLVGTVSGTYPSTGIFAVGDYVIDITGAIWICTVAGSPGTWAKTGTASSTYALTNLTAQSGALSNITLYTTPTAGLYTINYYGKVTTAATTNSVLGPFTVTSTDPDSNTVSTVGLLTTQNSVTAGVINGSITVYAGSGTNIQYSVPYTSNGATAMKYSLYAAVGGNNASIAVSGVSSFNGRSGAVSPSSSDYTAAQVGAVNALSISAARNNVINGGMDIWQRGTTFSNPNNVYTADRWLTTRYGGTGWTVSQTTAGSGLPQIQYALRIQSNSGSTAGGTYALQAIETANSLPFVGQTVTLSFYARIGALYSGAGSTNMTIQTGTGTDQSLYSGFTGQATALTIAPGSGGQPALTTSWQRYSATTSSAIASTVTQLGISLLTGGTGTAGATDYIDITGVQLEIGSTATAFSRAGGTIQGELAACQRYYWQINANGVTAGTNEVIGTGFNYNSTTVFIIPNRWPVTMRTAPSITAASGNISLFNNGSNYNVTSISALYNISPNTAIFQFSSTGLSVGQGTICWAFNPIYFNAEL